jgi:hypothetical protein
MLIVHDKEIKNTISNAKYSLERYKIKIGVQHMQHPKVVKIGYILFLIPKADIIE